MLKKAVLIFILAFALPVFALEETQYDKLAPIQKRINSIGFKILNANMLDKHIVFSYNKEDKLIKNDSAIKRQIVLQDKILSQAENDDEIAAYLAREIFVANRSFDGVMNGLISTAQIKMAPKKYELVSDKMAVDYLVKAGYNPIFLITFINKTCSQARQDKISRHNLTSKRLMYIYEKIYRDYPYFIVNNACLENEYYQNFLLNSINNRRILRQKIKSGGIKEIEYE